MKLLVIMLALTMINIDAFAENGEFQLDDRFIDHGIPIKESNAFSRDVGLDAQGQRHFYQARGQSPTPFFIMDTNMDTGETVQINCDVEGALFPWGMCVASNRKVYIGTADGGHLFEYDPETQKLRHLGRPGNETYIWTLDEGTDGKIYGGTYGHCKIIRYDPETDTSEDLGRMDPTEKYVRWVVASDDGYVYGGLGSSKFGVVAYDIESATWEQLIPEEQRGAGWGRLHKSPDGEIYAQTPIGNYKLEKGKTIPVDDIPKVVNFLYPDGSRITTYDQNNGILTLTEPDGEKISREFHPENAGSRLFVMHTGPDNKVYGSSFLPLRLFVHDPETGGSENLGLPTATGGEIYSFVNRGDELFMAAYPGCSVAKYNPDSPWNLGTEPGSNPQKSPKGLSKIVYRPHHMCVSPDNERILIIGLPDYGLLGGGVSILNPETLEIEEEYPHLVPNQSITSICLTDEGLVALGSSTAGGSGSHSTEKEAHFILWDYQERDIVHDVVPFPDESTIKGLAKGPDGMIYGLTYRGHLFVFDSKKREIVHREKLTDAHAILNPIQIDSRGKFIILWNTGIMELDPGTFEHRFLAKFPKGINSGTAIVNGRVYFGHMDHLMSFELPE